MEEEFSGVLRENRDSLEAVEAVLQMDRDNREALQVMK
jgi:hypothetical protein